MTSPTQRSLKWLRDQGMTAEVVERWNPHAKVRHDLFGSIDIVALFDSPMPPRMCDPPAFEHCWCLDQGRTIGVQATSGSNVSARIAKILAEPRMRLWIKCGNRLVVHGWRKLKVKRGGKAVRWELREEEITLGMFEMKETIP